MTQVKRTRRSIISTCSAAAPAVALAPYGQTTAQTPAAFRPARHPQDEWLDAVPGTHRTFIDASTVRGAGEALLYANNLFEANKAGYAVAERELATVVCLRHFATPFAFNDAVWGKYGAAMSTLLEFTDPKTRQPPSVNVFNVASYGMALPNLGNTIDGVRARGVRFAVCDMATHFVAGQLAAAGKGTADAIYAELAANLIPDSRLVPAGVVAVTRAQERGYALLTTL